MKNSFWILSIFMALICYSCREEISESTEVVTLNLEEAFKTQETGFASEFFDDVEMVVVDGKQEWYFPEHIISVKYYTNFTLHHDMHSRGPVGVFKRNGELLTILDKKGKGPGEYNGVSDFGMNPKETKIYVSEDWNGRIHWYDLSGEFIETVNFPTKYNNISPMPGNQYLIQNQRYDIDELDSTRLFLSNHNGELTKVVWNKSKEIKDFPQFMDSKWVKRTKDNHLYYRDSPLHDTIYLIDENFSIKPVYHMALGKLKIPESLATDFKIDDNEKRAYLRIHRFHFGSDYLLMSGSQNKWLNFVYDLNTKELKCYDEILDDLLGHRAIPYEISEDGKFLVTRVYPYWYKENMDLVFPESEVKYPELRQKIIDAINNADEDTEMILLYYRIK